MSELVHNNDNIIIVLTRADMLMFSGGDQVVEVLLFGFTFDLFPHGVMARHHHYLNFRLQTDFEHPLRHTRHCIASS